MGKDTSDLLLTILSKREQMQVEKLATKEDLHRLESKLVDKLHEEINKVHQQIGSMAWKMAGLLIAQTAVIMGLLKIAGVY